MDKGISFCPLAIIDEFWQKCHFSSIILYFCEVLTNKVMKKRCTVQEISELLENLPEGGIMKEIVDPVGWQRQQRKEWEIDWKK